MAICNIDELLACLRTGQCLLGLDPGRKAIGVAVSDPGLTVASPLTTIRRTKLVADLEAITGVIRDRAVGGLIVGLPRAMDGSEGPAAQSARAFVRHVLRLHDLPVVLWDERFSTVAVTRFMLEDDMTRKRRAETVDRAAAAWILQGALDRLAQIRRGTRDGQ